MLISLLFAMWAMGWHRKIASKQIIAPWKKPLNPSLCCCWSSAAAGPSNKS
jgi:hypothetical protein